MSIHEIKKGFDIRLAGKPEARFEEAPEPPTVGVAPPDFPGLKAKVTIKEGDRVATGDLLFFDKKDRDIRFLSPGTGKVTRVVLGERRAPQLVEIAPEGEERHAELPRIGPGQLAKVGREELILALKHAGLWPLLRQRPIGRFARADLLPSAIYVNGMDTEPLAADPALACQGQGEQLQLGINLLGRLTDGKVYLTTAAGRAPRFEFKELQGVEMHQFSGPHPAGLVGTHIHAIAPLKPGQVVWFLKAQEAALLGAWVRDGHYPALRTVAVSGTGAPKRQYYRVRQGAALETLTGGQKLGGDCRLINGTVLNGVAAEPEGHLGFYAQTLTILPTGGDKRDLFGWGWPQFSKYSASRAVFSWLTPKSEYDLDTRLNGGHRPLVNIGAMDRVMPLDIYMSYLMRAVKAGDLDEAINLGLLELTEEDVALCTFADPCKTEVGEVVRMGLDQYESEG